MGRQESRDRGEGRVGRYHLCHIRIAGGGEARKEGEDTDQG